MRPDGQLEFSYDAVSDVLTVEGVKYSGGLFRAAAIARPYTWLKFEEGEDGSRTVTEVRNESVPRV